MHRVFSVKPGVPHFDNAVLWMKLVTPASILIIAHNVLSTRFDLENQQQWMGVMFGLMDMYVRPSDNVSSLILYASVPYEQSFRNRISRKSNVTQSGYLLLLSQRLLASFLYRHTTPTCLSRHHGSFGILLKPNGSLASL